MYTEVRCDIGILDPDMFSVKSHKEKLANVILTLYSKAYKDEGETLHTLMEFMTMIRAQAQMCKQIDQLSSI